MIIADQKAVIQRFPDHFILPLHRVTAHVVAPIVVLHILRRIAEGIRRIAAGIAGLIRAAGVEIQVIGRHGIPRLTVRLGISLDLIGGQCEEFFRLVKIRVIQHDVMVGKRDDRVAVRHVVALDLLHRAGAVRVDAVCMQVCLVEVPTFGEQVVSHVFASCT